MAIDTREKRASIQGYGGLSCLLAPLPNGGIGRQDRRQLTGLYPFPPADHAEAEVIRLRGSRTSIGLAGSRTAISLTGARTAIRLQGSIE